MTVRPNSVLNHRKSLPNSILYAHICQIENSFVHGICIIIQFKKVFKFQFKEMNHNLCVMCILIHYETPCIGYTHNIIMNNYVFSCHKSLCAMRLNV